MATIVATLSDGGVGLSDRGRGTGWATGGRGSTGIAGWGWLHDCGSFGDESAVREIATPCGLAMTVVGGGVVPQSGSGGQVGWTAGACPRPTVGCCGYFGGWWWMRGDSERSMPVPYMGVGIIGTVVVGVGSGPLSHIAMLCLAI